MLKSALTGAVISTGSVIAVAVAWTLAQKESDRRYARSASLAPRAPLFVRTVPAPAASGEYELVA